MWQKIKRIFENKRIKFVTKVIYLKCDEIGSASIKKIDLIIRMSFGI